MAPESIQKKVWALAQDENLQEIKENPCATKSKTMMETFRAGGKLCCPNDYELEVVAKACEWLKWSLYKHFKKLIKKMTEMNWGFSFPLVNLLNGVTNKDKNIFHVMLEGFCPRGAIKLCVLLNIKQWGCGNIGMARKSIGESPLRCQDWRSNPKLL
jgi:hypothetical protein